LGLYSYGERLQPRPHLTVARRVDESTIAALSDWALTRPRFAWHVDRLVLLRSHMGPAGSRYEELASNLLTGRGNPA
jgi:2'-5' RNA ligase